MLKAGLDADQAFVGNKNGDAKGAIAGAAKKVEAVYAYPFQNHAPMEPMNATARYTADRCEVWVPTQNGEAAFAATTAASGLPADKCEVYKINLGGGFGRRGAFHDYVTQAVLIAKQIPGTPVKMIWSREEDMTHGRYHPVTQAKLIGALDASGNLTGLHCASRDSRSSGRRVPAGSCRTAGTICAFQGLNPSGDFAFGYTVPNLLIDHAMRNTHVPPGFWRGVNINQNAIYIECFMDELAQAAGQDPLEFRRKLMTKHPKHLAVLNAVADRAGWGKPAPQGVYRGLAQMMAFDSYVAACAEISVSGGDKVKVHRIVCATDPGYAVNPAQIERQIAGSFVYGLSALFMEECTVKDGRIEQENFHDVRLDADRADAEGRVDHHAVRRVLGRGRRAHDLRGGARRPQRVLRRDGQAPPHDPAEAPRPHAGVSDAEGPGRGDRARLDRRGRGGVGGAAGRRRGVLGVSSRIGAGVVAGAAPRRARSGGDRQGHAGLPLGAAARHRHGPDRQGLHRRGDPGDRRLVRDTAVNAGRRAFLKLGVAATASAASSLLESSRRGPPRASWSSGAASPARAAPAPSGRRTRASP